MVVAANSRHVIGQVVTNKAQLAWTLEFGAANFFLSRSRHVVR